MDHILSKGYLLTGGVAFARWQVVKAVAGSTISPAQCARMVSATDAGVIPLGVCMEDVDLAKVNTGKAIAQIATNGNVKCIWDGVGAAPTPGAVVKLSAATAGTKDGQVTVATKAAGGVAPVAVVGTVLDILGNSIGQTATAGDWFDVELNPGMMF
jgi:hypothetical protein